MPWWDAGLRTVWRRTYERAKASAKATDKNKSCMGEAVSFAIGTSDCLWQSEARRTLHDECLLDAEIVKKGGLKNRAIN